MRDVAYFCPSRTCFITAKAELGLAKPQLVLVCLIVIYCITSQTNLRCKGVDAFAFCIKVETVFAKIVRKLETKIRVSQ